MPFSIEHLQTLLNKCESVHRIWVAYSGGVDSHALLHRIQSFESQLPEIAGVVHINHGIHSDSDSWSKHCKAVATDLSLNYIEEKVILGEGEGLEDQARRARYSVFENLLEKGDVLLMAHHQDDQAETFLLQALRGGGPKGIAAMPAVSELGLGCLLRPMLGVKRDEIINYASHHGLEWIEDSSNQDERFDRNHLRHSVMPLLEKRWPNAAGTLSRTAEHTASLVNITDELLQDELKGVTGRHGNTLSIKALLALDNTRAALLIRALCQKLIIPVPSTVHIKELLERQLLSDIDRQILVSWPGGEFRRFQDDLYILSAERLDWSDAWEYDWCESGDIDIPELKLSISRVSVTGRGLHPRYFEACLQIKPRKGGERFRAVNDAHTRELKAIYQYHGIPSWERQRMPLLYADDELIAVGDLVVCAHSAVSKEEKGYEIQIKRY